jgi:hypothetical protein
MAVPQVGGLPSRTLGFTAVSSHRSRYSLSVSSLIPEGGPGTQLVTSRFIANYRCLAGCKLPLGFSNQKGPVYRRRIL